MSKRMLLIGLLVVGAALLSSCDLLDNIIGAITGGGSPGGGIIMPEYPISGRMKFSLAATVWRDDGYTGAHSYAGNVATTFWSGAGLYSEEHRSFNANIWDSEDFSLTSFIAYFAPYPSEDEKTITQFVAGQMQANTWGGLTYWHQIRGVNVPYSHKEGNSRYYRIEGTAVRALVTELEFSMWVPGAGGSQQNPLEWITGEPAAITGNVDDYIEIRLDYQNTATAP